MGQEMRGAGAYCSCIRRGELGPAVLAVGERTLGPAVGEWSWEPALLVADDWSWEPAFLAVVVRPTVLSVDKGGLCLLCLQ